MDARYTLYIEDNRQPVMIWENEQQKKKNKQIAWKHEYRHDTADIAANQPRQHVVNFRN